MNRYVFLALGVAALCVVALQPGCRSGGGGGTLRIDGEYWIDKDPPNRYTPVKDGNDQKIIRPSLPPGSKPLKKQRVRVTPDSLGRELSIDVCVYSNPEDSTEETVYVDSGCDGGPYELLRLWRIAPESTASADRRRRHVVSYPKPGRHEQSVTFDYDTSADSSTVAFVSGSLLRLPEFEMPAAIFVDGVDARLLQSAGWTRIEPGSSILIAGTPSQVAFAAGYMGVSDMQWQDEHGSWQILFVAEELPLVVTIHNGHLADVRVAE